MLSEEPCVRDGQSNVKKHFIASPPKQQFPLVTVNLRRRHRRRLRRCAHGRRTRSCRARSERLTELPASAATGAWAAIYRPRKVLPHCMRGPLRGAVRRALHAGRAVEHEETLHCEPPQATIFTRHCEPQQGVRLQETLGDTPTRCDKTLNSNRRWS